MKVLLLLLISCFNLVAQPLPIYTTNHLHIHIALAWTCVDDPDVIGYNLYWGAESGVYTNYIDCGNTNFCTVTNLNHNQVYYFTATSYSINGTESDHSNEAVYTPTINTHTNCVVIVTGANFTSTVSPNGPWFENFDDPIILTNPPSFMFFKGPNCSIVRTSF